MCGSSRQAAGDEPVVVLSGLVDRLADLPAPLLLAVVGLPRCSKGRCSPVWCFPASWCCSSARRWRPAATPRWRWCGWSPPAARSPATCRLRHRSAFRRPPPHRRLGRWVGERRWAAAEAALAKAGGRGVFAGKFVGVVRPLVPPLAGALGLPRRQLRRRERPGLGGLGGDPRRHRRRGRVVGDRRRRHARPRRLDRPRRRAPVLAAVALRRRRSARAVRRIGGGRRHLISVACRPCASASTSPSNASPGTRWSAASPRRGPRLRRRLGLRPLPAHVRRGTGRDLRGDDDAGGAGGTDLAHPARAAGGRRDLPPPVGARRPGDDDRPRQPRPPRAVARRGVVRQGAPRARHPVPVDRASASSSSRTPWRS